MVEDAARFNAILRDETRSHVLPIFVQCKFREQQTNREVNEALRTVDPALLPHEKRHTTRFGPKPIPGVDATRREFRNDVLSRVPVMRVVTSGKAHPRRGVRYVQRGAVRDVLGEVVLDAERVWWARSRRETPSTPPPCLAPRAR